MCGESRGSNWEGGRRERDVCPTLAWWARWTWEQVCLVWKPWRTDHGIYMHACMHMHAHWWNSKELWKEELEGNCTQPRKQLAGGAHVFKMEVMARAYTLENLGMHACMHAQNTRTAEGGREEWCRSYPARSDGIQQGCLIGSHEAESLMIESVHVILCSGMWWLMSTAVKLQHTKP